MRVAGRDAGSVGTGQKISLDDATDDLNTHTHSAVAEEADSFSVGDSIEYIRVLVSRLRETCIIGCGILTTCI